MLTESIVGVCACIGSVLCGLFLNDGGAIYYVSCAAIVLSAAVYCFIDEQFTHAHRTSLVAFVSIMIAVCAYILYEKTGLSQRFTDFDALKKFILDSGFWGIAIFLGLTLFQVVILPVPAALTIVLGVAIYGPTLSFILSTIGTIAGSLIAFSLGKIFGRRLCNWMFGEESTDKYARLLDERGRWLFAIMLLFPAFPDDMLCTVAGITNMSYAYFTIVCIITRPVMIAVTAYLGSGIIPFSGWGIPVWIGIIALFVFMLIAIARFKSQLTRGKSDRSERKERGMRKKRTV